MHHPKVEELVRRDPRYPLEAYEFVYAALNHTQELLGRPACEQVLLKEQAKEEDRHVSGKQLLYGIRDLALREFGLMARAVFRMWGINRTDDFGEIVFNLVEAGLMSTTPQDERKDFHNVYNLDVELMHEYRIEFPSESAGDV
jgi:uncharacterized repeat protein (TIGR04138 family)